LSKEYSLYLREADEQQRKLDRLIAEHAEDWDIKNAVSRGSLIVLAWAQVVTKTKMMEESNKMIVDSEIRLANAIGELRDLVVRRSL
jgi:tubulin-specific chaperone A